MQCEGVGVGEGVVAGGRRCSSTVLYRRGGVVVEVSLPPSCTGALPSNAVVPYFLRRGEDIYLLWGHTV